MSEKQWKASERAVAKHLGGRRIPVTGRARGSAPDVQHPWLSIEVKHRKALPTWLLTAVRQARAAAGPSQLPLVVLHQVGERHGNDLVVLRLGDFRDWFGDAENLHDLQP